MKRRRLLLAGAALPLATLLGAHTPYRQWVVYRKQHLLVGCHRQDEGAYPRAKAIEAVLARHLPDAQARVARAPDAARLASLFATGQLELGLLRTEEAKAMRAGSGPFAAYGPVPLKALAATGPHVLYATGDFTEAHVSLLLHALAQARTELAFGTPGEEAGPFHPEAAHWFEDHH